MEWGIYKVLPKFCQTIASNQQNKPRKGVSRNNRAPTSQLKQIQSEIRATPKVGPARSDPPPVATQNSLFINRVVRVQVPTATATIDVGDILAQLPSNVATKGFRILKASIWVLGNQTCGAVLNGEVWGNRGGSSSAANDNMSYVDIAPTNRLAGVMFNIPDTLAIDLTTNTTVVVSGLSTVAPKVVDFTVRFQM
jgi:hypothetical protein